MNKREILIRVLRGSATRKEHKQLEQWLSSQDEFAVLEEGISQEVDIKPTSADLAEIRRLLHASQRRRQRIAALLALVVISLIITIIVVLLHRRNATKDLIFHDTDISTVITRLESSFGVTIQYRHDSNQPCRFTGELYRVQSIDDALYIVRRATGMTWNKTATKVYTINMRCNQ